jgi:hypothetical protein
MTSELAPIDVRHAPPLAELVEEVRATRKPRRLVRDDEDVALLVPAPPAPRRRGRVPSQEDYEAFLASAGGWQDEDTDVLIERIYESRRSSRPPVEL